MTILDNAESRNGFTFDGWSETENGNATYKPGDTFKITGNVNLYPVWKKIPEYTITYHLNNGTISQKSVYKGEATTVDVSDSRTEYEFQGWTTMKEGAVVYKIGDKVEITENMDFYPVWTVDPDPGGPSEPADPSKPSEKGDESEEPTIPSEPSDSVDPPKPSEKGDSPEGPADPSEPSEPTTPSEPSQKDEPATDDETDTSDTDASSDSDGGSGLGLASVAAIAGVTVAVAALMVMIFRRT